MLCSKSSAFSLLMTLSLVGYLLLATSAVEAQTYLYNSSYIGTGSSPLGAALADFNRDGRSDLAAVNYNNTVSVMLGAPNAAFGSPASYPTAASPFTLIAADLRRNGTIDLVTVNMPNGIDQPGLVSVLLGNGDGTFQVHADYLVGDFPTGIVAGDFNGDGKIDMVITNKFDNNISILYGNGNGTFQTQALVDVGSEPASISTGDFDGDGRTDVIASCVGSGVVSVLLNKGAGVFTRVDTSSGVSGPDTSFVVTGDFTSDGTLDAVISSKIQEQLYLLKGEGNGKFASPTPLVANLAGQVYSLVAADINRDGKTDLAFGSVGPSEFSVLFGRGNGRFSGPVVSPVFATESITFADINGDGFLDLVVAEQNLGSVAVVLGRGNGKFGVPKSVNLSGTVSSPNSTVVADFNGDGKLDLAVAETNFPIGQVAVSLGKGRGAFELPVVSPLLSAAINNQDDMSAGDFNGDGKPDLIIMDDFSTGFQVLLGNGDGSFQPPVDTKLNTALNFAIGDFNGDSKTDIVVSTTFNFQPLISIYLSKGDGTFTLGAQYTEQSGGPAVADVNRDGKPDLVFGTSFVMLGNGDGTFQKPITGQAVPGQSFMAINDFNGDGTPDIVFATFKGLAFFKGNGDGTFLSPVYSEATTLLCCQLLTEDVNGDGKLDLVNNDGSTVLVLLGNGDGTFQSPFGYGVIGQLYTGNMLVGDFNLDGIGDIGVVYEDATSGTINASFYASTPTVALFPTSIDFGSIGVGHTSTPVAVRLSDAGNQKLSISGIQITGAFVQKNKCPPQLGIGKGCTIEVVFKPQQTGAQIGAVTITDSARGISQQVSLTGIGK